MAEELDRLREQIARTMHDTATGRIVPDESDPIPYGRMAAAVLDEVVLPLLEPMRAKHYTPYADEEHQGGYCFDFFAPTLARMARAERERDEFKRRLAAAQLDMLERGKMLDRAEASRQAWAEEAMRLQHEMEELATGFHDRALQRAEADGRGDSPQCDGDCDNDDCHMTSAVAAWQMAAATVQRRISAAHDALSRPQCAVHPGGPETETEGGTP